MASYISDDDNNLRNMEKNNDEIAFLSENCDEKTESTMCEIARLKALLRQRQQEEMIKEQEHILKMREIYEKRMDAEKLLLMAVKSSENSLKEQDKLSVAYKRQLNLVGEMKETIRDAQVAVEQLQNLTENQTTELKTNALETEIAQLKQHIDCMDSSIVDVITKYGKVRDIALDLKKSEGEKLLVVQDLERKCCNIDTKIQQTEASAKTELDKCGSKIEETQKIYDKEMPLLLAQVRKANVKCEASEKSLENIIADNNRMLTLCDDIISGNPYDSFYC